MTAKQKAARAKFKQVVAEAKKLRKKNPKLTQAQAVKQAWAIEYKKAPRKVAEVGKVKKSAPKKKAAVKKAAPKKKAAVKKAAKKSTSYHKDTKSHNVNIRVVSGINKTDILNDLKKIEQNINALEITLQKNKETMKKFPYKTQFWKSYFKKKNTEISNYIKSLKKQKTDLKKHI